MKNIARYFRYGIGCAFRFYSKRILLCVFNTLATDTTYRPIQDARMAILRILGADIQKDCSIWENLYLLNGKNLSIGEGSVIGSYCSIYDWSPIRIGRKLFASNNLTIVSASHKTHDYSSIPGPISIGDNVWIGINVTIIGPVTIGNNCIIGAGSVVLKDIPDCVIAAGTPAKIIRKIM